MWRDKNMKERLLKKVFVTAGFFLISGVALHAADSAMPDNRPGRRNSGRASRFGNGMMNNRVIVEAQIAHADPQKYAELEKIREQYEKDMAALAEKNGIKLPASLDDNFRKLWKAEPEKFTAIALEIKNSPREGMKKLFALAREAGIKFGPERSFGRRQNNDAGEHSYMPRNFNRPDLSALRRNYPAEMKKYDELRKTDPAGARKILLELIENTRKQNK